MTEISQEAYNDADGAISDLADEGHDYSAQREELALFFDTYLYDGNWDMTTDFTDTTKPNLRFIQEDEFDQQWTDDMPEFEEQICYTSPGHYVFLVD